jgi:FkbM family methyltransferase
MKQIDGVWIPDGGEVCYQWSMVEIGIPSLLINVAQRLNKKPRSVVHAGGNIGLYAIEFSKHADNVYVFEPSNQNFHALAMNCAKHENIFLYKSALGNQNTPIELVNNEPINSGTWRVKGIGGNIPTLKIDDLCLSDVDIIHLDIEGYELYALQGAEKTILKSFPVVAFELMQHSDKYNYTKKDIFEYVQSLGYNKYHFYANEVVFIKE